MAIEDLLSGLDGWLVSHAPKTHAMLKPAATSDQIARLETALGFSVLPELVTALRWHNGTLEDVGGFELAPTYLMLDSESIADDARSLRTTAAEYDRDDWNERLVPIGADRCGSYLLVDHREGDSHGRTFTWEPESGEGESWPSLEALCSELFGALVHRKPLMECNYEVVDGAVEWEELD